MGCTVAQMSWQAWSVASTASFAGNADVLLARKSWLIMSGALGYEQQVQTICGPIVYRSSADAGLSVVVWWPW